MSVSPVNRRLRKLHRERLSLLEDWYGPEFASSEVAAHVSTPIPLSRGVRELMNDLETPQQRSFRLLREIWPQIVGAEFARLAEPANWGDDGVLSLEVRHSALLRELRSSAELIKMAVQKRFPEANCEEVKLVISGGGRRYRPDQG